MNSTTDLALAPSPSPDVVMATQKPPEGHFQILYFAAASSYTRKTSESLPAPLPLDKLFQALEERYAGITAKVLDSCMVTVNMEYVDVPPSKSAENSKEDVVVSGSDSVEQKAVQQEQVAMIKEGDEVAIIPPVSSG